MPGCLSLQHPGQQSLDTHAYTHAHTQCHGRGHHWHMVQTGTHSWMCVSCRTASGPVARDGDHGGGGGAAAGLLVCRDPVVCAVQVSRQETWACCSASGHAVLCSVWEWRSGSPRCSHPSPGAEDAAGCSYHSVAVGLLAGAHEHLPWGWVRDTISCCCCCHHCCPSGVLVRGPEGGCAELSMPLLLGSAGP